MILNVNKPARGVSPSKATVGSGTWLRETTPAGVRRLRSAMRGPSRPIGGHPAGGGSVVLRRHHVADPTDNPAAFLDREVDLGLDVESPDPESEHRAGQGFGDAKGRQDVGMTGGRRGTCGIRGDGERAEPEDQGVAFDVIEGNIERPRQPPGRVTVEVNTIQRPADAPFQRVA